MTGPNRRQFLGAAGAVIAAPAFVSSSVRGANERLRVGHIGVGGRAGSLLSYDRTLQKAGLTQVVGLCDIDKNRLAKAANDVPDAKVYFDYREMLEREDIDAVMIGTPDHWHAVQTVHACETGKHVYVEKPSSVTIEEGNAMIAAAERHKRVIQVGSQARSAEPAHQACLYIRNGMIGPVRKVTCWHRCNPTAAPTPDSPPPSEWFWDMWLGPLRWRPHNRSYYPGSFRFFLESGGGVIRDRGAHVFSVVRWCLDADQQQPVSVEALGTPPKQGLFDCPVEMNVVYTFEDPDWQLIWAQPGERQSNYPEQNRDFGMVFHGENEKLILDRDGTRYAAPEKARRFTVPADGVHISRVSKHGDYNVNHVEDWVESIRTSRKPIMHIQAAHNAATLCIIGNLSYVLGRKLDWDGKNQRFINDEPANRLLSTPQRHPYHL